MLRLWSSKLHFWRKSRTKASFLSFKASFLKEVSHKSFVFELQSFIFEGSLAQKLRFWSSKLHFWRKSRRNASFLIFKASFLKEVSHKSFVFELQSFIFEGSLAQKLRFWASELHFWRKSRRNASFLIFKASFLKEVSQNSFRQSVSQSVSQINQSVSQSVSQSDSQSVSQPISRQIISQSVNQSVS